MPGENVQMHQQTEFPAETSDAQFETANAHALGLFFLERNYSTAVRLYQSAAKAGHAGAMTTLGFAYVEGKLDLPVDIPQGLRFFEEAAAAGDEEASSYLHFLRTGERSAHI